MDSFFLMGAKPLVQNSPTMKLHELLDWEEIAHKLKGLYKREATHGGGPEPYAALAMFKLMLLGQWHGLSDTQQEPAGSRRGTDAFFGYRSYSAVDTEDGYIEHVEVHPANQAEVNKLPGLVDALIEQGIQPEGVLADKGYASAANRAYLQSKGIGDLIQFKGSRGQPVHRLQTQMNRAIATLRYKVEQGFGTLKRRFHMSRARYFEVAKTQAQMAWAALGLNLLKAMRKLQGGRLQPCAGSSPS
ncbi:transposase [Roseateles sp. BYS180W]|uniref:Transposase n=1 Tax=Roseateles rivi TaxID=3299028 RepID=A0ABW7FVG5_9BURK